MNIIVNLDVMMAKRKMSLNELSQRVGISNVNLSILKTGKAKGVRFDTLASICQALQCQPGDLLACVETSLPEESAISVNSLQLKNQSDI